MSNSLEVIQDMDVEALMIQNTRKHKNDHKIFQR